jgi:hypothetical protein
MAAAKKRTKANAADLIADEDLTPSQRVAREILVDFSDLSPSVTHHAGRPRRRPAAAGDRAFRASLGRTDDPNRDPRYAIANCG